ncbi:MAG: NAD-dependent epimerase/dehydratase family protein, partial [Anaerolineales bacterium]|nr:NAD-dependent epimerase/dehydratase family protein [Anaerolineales bacterium]
MKVLFIGGTGIISSACSTLAIEHGFELYLLNRGITNRRVPEGAKRLQGDIRDKASVLSAIDNLHFDVVVNWISYTPEHIDTDIDLFSERTHQYVFISSASVYQTPPAVLPVTEFTPLDNPFWEYSRNKIACEEKLVRAYKENGFPITIVRPSHTYDRTTFPVHGGYTVVNRMRKGKKVVVHGDGSSLWVLTHHRDFAKGFVGLLGNDDAIGEDFHITSDELLTWNQIHEIIADAASIKADLTHVPSNVIAELDREWGDSLLGDKTHSMIFNNTKIKQIVPSFSATIPFSVGVKEIIQWHDEEHSRRFVDESLDQLMDVLIQKYDTA